MPIQWCYHCLRSPLLVTRHQYVVASACQLECDHLIQEIFFNEIIIAIFVLLNTLQQGGRSYYEKWLSVQQLVYIKYSYKFTRRNTKPSRPSVFIATKLIELTNKIEDQLSNYETY